MLPIASMAAFGGHRALFQKPPRGTCSRIISLRLHRRSRATPYINSGGFSQCQSIHPVRGLATAVQSTNAISDQEFALFRDLLLKPKSQTRPDPRDAVSTNESLDTAGDHVANPLPNDLVEKYPRPFQKALEALQQRDTRRFLIYMRQIPLMNEMELQAAVAALPRTTFTELLRSLDPVSVARDADPTDQTNIQVGTYQTLHLESVVDEWGVRKLYPQLLQCMLALTAALKASGQILQTEEYVYLLRCAGAASDPTGAKWLWDDMVRTHTVDWRQGELYTEFVCARFLTRPLYTGYDKTRRLVHPRNLHRARTRLNWRCVLELDRLRFKTRLARLYKGLLKESPHVEDIMRKMRKNRPITKVFFKALSDGHFISESLLCALMIGFGRAGSLRFIASRILYPFFGIDMGRLTYNEEPNSKTAYHENLIESHACRVRPSVRLMEAVVEAYGSNGEIAIAFQLIDHISKRHQISIPRSVWRDLLEWTFIMGSPSVSTAWKKADMKFKVPSSEAIELIFGAMVSHHLEPGFEEYSILIRNLLARHRFASALPFMRKAVEIYDAQCQEYEKAVLVYVQMIRDGVRVSDAVHRYERARFKKAKMWYDIGQWCRKYLSSVRSFSPANPLTVVAVPDFIREFRPFIRDPAQYRIATGYVSLHDPAEERLYGVYVSHLPMEIPMKSESGWGLESARARKLAILSSRSLAGYAPVSKLGLVTMLTSIARTLNPSSKRSRLENVVDKKSRPWMEKPSDEDDDYF
ncbi:hypothetical protein F5Y13DRAFT_170043 [Hypoxylon sp. FL1857]|nr:hypothetical protein F5Y13DRAFT_170043 [Hypoxylon sp. FL1857]